MRPGNKGAKSTSRYLRRHGETEQQGDITYGDNNGKEHKTKFRAQAKSFYNFIKGGLMSGFPVVVKWIGNYQGIAIYPLILFHKYATIELINHERIHARQQFECFVVFAYLLYTLEFLIRFVAYGFDAHKAYRNISFEREAKANEKNRNYLFERKPYSFLHYLWY